MAIKIHTANVTNNLDPELRGRVKFVAQTLLGEQEHPEWAEPIGIGIGGGFGVLIVPEIGAPIEVEVDDEDCDYTPKYRGGFFTLQQTVPVELVINYPRRRGIKTPNLLAFTDDTPGVGLLLIQDQNGNMVEIRQGQILIKSQAGKLVLDGVLIDVGEGATHNIPYAQELYAKLNVQFAMLRSHYHMVSSEGSPTGPPVPGPPSFPGPGTWSSPIVKVK